MIKTWFITGTDTNIGKTTISTILLNKASKIGYYTAGYKPIATGSTQENKGIYNNDVLLLQQYSSVNLKYKELNIFSYRDSIPPNFIIEDKYNIDFYQMSEGLNNLKKKSNWIIIEGVGGWYTPIFHTMNFSSWVIAENIPVILIVGIKLGCMNHAILTNEALIKPGIYFSGWITNCCEKYEEKHLQYYIKTIKKYIKAPYLGNMPYVENKKDFIINKNNIVLPA